MKDHHQISVKGFCFTQSPVPQELQESAKEMVRDWQRKLRSEVRGVDRSIRRRLERVGQGDQQHKRRSSPTKNAKFMVISWD